MQKSIDNPSFLVHYNLCEIRYFLSVYEIRGIRDVWEMEKEK